MPKRKPEDETNPRLRDIRARIIELQELYRKEARNDEGRLRLLKWVQANRFNRSDVFWVYNKLPFMRAQRALPIPTILPKKQLLIRPEMVPFGKALREARTKKDMTAHDVGKAVGIHPSMINNWERGMWRPKPEMYEKLVKLLGPLPPLPPLPAPIKRKKGQ